jgi:hypothetical protein
MKNLKALPVALEIRTLTGILIKCYRRKWIGVCVGVKTDAYRVVVGET